MLSIVGSETAPLWVEVAAFLRTSLPYVEEREIDGVGHLLQLHDRASVASAAAEFLARNPMDEEHNAAAPASPSPIKVSG